MNARVSKISLVVFVVLLVTSGLLLAVAGDRWPWYAVMAVFASVPVILGPSRYRVWGVIGLLLSVALIASDIYAGRHIPERRLPSESSIKGEVPAPNK